ncbi:MAG: hypothetical protein NXI04_14665 [Planctomycetaceae bacterium]|nr:hypothetical protein [Planctomycetaceae bacterium]
MRKYAVLATFVFALTLPSFVFAHFIWLVPGADGEPTMVCFGEDAADQSVEFLPRLKGMQVQTVASDGQATPVELTWSKESLTMPSAGKGQILLATHDLGVMDRADSVFRLKYYAKAGPDVTAAAWKKTRTAQHTALDLVPLYRNGKVRIRVLFAGQPAPDAQVKASGPNLDFEGQTNAKGMVTLPAASGGLYSIRARHVQSAGGELDGRTYGETRHYVTVALKVPRDTETADSAARLDDIPEPVTSFGAAVLGDAVYMYGGHMGGAHSYSKAEQNNQLSKLNLKTGKWATCVEGPHLQGLALVPSGNRLFRIGGFTAENAEGEDHRLVSQSSVAAWDEQSGWTTIPDLPEARSSHDAAVLDGVIYVVGGWKMAPDEETQWHTTAWKLDPSAANPQWQAIADPGFQRRAIAVAAHAGKIYVVGGMDEESGPTTAVSVYDPKQDSWTDGPALQVVKEGQDRMSSGGMSGFGAAAFATGGALYVTTVQGVLQRLSDDGSTWQVVKTGLTPRFFHRMIPVSDHSFVVFGGSNMSVGKFDAVELVNVEDGK